MLEIKCYHQLSILEQVKLIIISIASQIYIIIQVLFLLSMSEPLSLHGSSAPATVDVSWSPPSNGANGITGYRIYYGNGQNVLVPLVTVITSVSLKVDRSYIGQNVSIRSEADQFYSESINVSIIDSKQYSKSSYSCYYY